MPARSGSQRVQLDRAASGPLATTASAPRAAALVVACLLCYTLLEAGLGVWWFLQLGTVGPCQKDNEGSWSIGIFKGPSPLQLQPLELHEPRQDTSVAWPVANPVLTCASVGDSPSNFVADPFLLQRDQKLYMFYETKSTEQQKGQIGVAVSSDGGMTFQHQAVVLDLAWHLSYPFVFEHNGQVYMLPEASGSGRLSLYRATDFPLAWQEDRLLLPRPLIDASLVEWGGRWYLLGSDHTRPGAMKNGHLEVWHAASPLGPWEPHPANPVANGARAAGFRNAGRLVKHGGRLYRFGQDCGATYGHRLVAFEVTKLSPTEFEQHPIEHNISGLSGHRKPSWNSERHHHIDVQQLPSGEWIAAIDGDRVASGPISRRAILTVVRIVVPWILLAGVWMAVSISMTHSPAFRRWAISGGLVSAPAVGREPRSPMRTGILLHSSLMRRMQLGQLSRKKARSLLELDVECAAPLLSGDSGEAGAVDGVVLAAVEKLGDKQQQQQTLSPTSSNASKLAQQAAMEEGRLGKAAQIKSPPGGTTLQYRVTRSMSTRGSGGAISPPPLSGMSRAGSLARSGSARAQQQAARRRRCVPLRLQLGTFGMAFLAVAALLGLVGLYGYVAPFLETSKPFTVDGQFSQFTLLCMSYEARMSTLRHFVRHYSRCPSVSDIVLVWNKGKPPVPERDFDSAVPVRVRLEALNSLNNRFRQDPLIRNRAVLSLDDDIMVPCSDLERGFATWRMQPAKMVGFYPRLIEGTPLEFRGERYSIERSMYNAVLTGAAFLDTWTALPAYWADAVAPARAEVDRVFNGEDLLMNFVLANASLAAGSRDAVEFTRPTRRLDISKLSGVGISHNWNGFIEATQDYLANFTATFGGVPLQTHNFNWGHFSPPFCAITSLGCVYL